MIGAVSSVLAMVVCFRFSEMLDFQRMDFKLKLVKWGSLKPQYKQGFSIITNSPAKIENIVK